MIMFAPYLFFASLNGCLRAVSSAKPSVGELDSIVGDSSRDLRALLATSLRCQIIDLETRVWHIVHVRRATERGPWW